MYLNYYVATVFYVECTTDCQDTGEFVDSHNREMQQRHLTNRIQRNILLHQTAQMFNCDESCTDAITLHGTELLIVLFNSGKTYKRWKTKVIQITLRRRQRLQSSYKPASYVHSQANSSNGYPIVYSFQPYHPITSLKFWIVHHFNSCICVNMMTQYSFIAT